MQQFLSNLIAGLAGKKAKEIYEKSQKENIGMIKLPGFFFWFGITEMIVCATLMVILFLFFLPQEGAWSCIGILGFMFVTGLVLVIIQKNCLIVYRERELIYRNFFRITIRFDCREIKCAYYKNGGGILLVFKDGRKFGFGKEESFFYRQLIKREHVICQFKEEEKPSIKVGYTPLFTAILWIVCAIPLPALIAQGNMDAILIIICDVLFCFWLLLEMRIAVYDKKRKILTVRQWGMRRKYDMNYCKTDLVYKNGVVEEIAVYENNKKVAKIPVSNIHKNSAELAYVLCGKYVYDEWK